VAHVLVFVGCPLHVNPGLGPHEYNRTRVTPEHVYGVPASEGVGDTQFALSFV